MMEGILLFIFAACLHFRQIPGKEVQMTSFSSPGVLETQYSLEPRNALWCDGAFPLGAGAGGIQTRRELLDRKALQEYYFLTGSLLLEQREKFGCNFISSRTSVAIWVHEADLAPWGAVGGSKPYRGFWCECLGGWRCLCPSCSSPVFV